MPSKKNRFSTKKGLSPASGITGSWLLDSFQKRNIPLSEACEEVKLPTSLVDSPFNFLPFEGIAKLTQPGRQSRDEYLQTLPIPS